MRLISQNGAIDVPYEMSAIRNDDKLIILCMAGETGKGSVIATYSTSEKAQKAMEMLRTAYVGLPILFQNVDMNESVVDKLKEWKRDGIVLLHDNADSKIEQVNNAIFQFPQDEDVEV